MVDKNGNVGLLFSTETDKVGLMWVVMGLESSNYYIRVEELREVRASLGFKRGRIRR